MGCDIHGWIEANFYATQNDPDSEFAWESVVDLEHVLPRSYSVFGRLAHDGSRQQPGDRAIFANRGIPPKENLGDNAIEAYEYREADAHHETHFTHAELTQTRVVIGVGEKESEGVVPIDYLREALEEMYRRTEDDENYNTDMAYGRKKRGWEAAFGMSEALAERCGHEQVRWVIWFDN